MATRGHKDSTRKRKTCSKRNQTLSYAAYIWHQNPIVCPSSDNSTTSHKIHRTDFNHELDESSHGDENPVVLPQTILDECSMMRISVLGQQVLKKDLIYLVVIQILVMPVVLKFTVMLMTKFL